MEPVFATVAEEDGVSVTSAEVNGFTLSELRFPRSYVQAPFEPDLPYLAVVLEGGLVKSFPRRALELQRASAVAIPQGATHGASFGSDGAHPASLARAFRAHYGLSVGEYGRRLRLAGAAAELAGSETPLAEIAANAGFADQSHFTRVFRRHVGTTPARYRAQARSRAFQDR